MGRQTQTKVLVMDTLLGSKSRNEGAIKVPHSGMLFKHITLIIDMVIKVNNQKPLGTQSDLPILCPSQVDPLEQC